MERRHREVREERLRQRGERGQIQGGKIEGEIQEKI